MRVPIKNLSMVLQLILISGVIYGTFAGTSTTNTMATTTVGGDMTDPSEEPATTTQGSVTTNGATQDGSTESGTTNGATQDGSTEGSLITTTSGGCVRMLAAPSILVVIVTALHQLSTYYL